MIDKNDLCPKGWAWVIKDCDMLESSCKECMQAQAPIGRKEK